MLLRMYENLHDEHVSIWALSKLQHTNQLQMLVLVEVHCLVHAVHLLHWKKISCCCVLGALYIFGHQRYHHIFLVVKILCAIDQVDP